MHSRLLRLFLLLSMLLLQAAGPLLHTHTEESKGASTGIHMHWDSVALHDASSAGTWQSPKQFDHTHLRTVLLGSAIDNNIAPHHFAPLLYLATLLAPPAEPALIARLLQTAVFTPRFHYSPPPPNRAPPILRA